MLFPIPSLRRQGLRREGFAKWRALDDDPQFLFAPGWVRASYLLIDMASAEGVMDPWIYIDEGEGFLPEQALELRPTKHGLFVIALKSFRRVRRIRFDPSTYPAQFEFRAFAGFDEASARSFVGRRMRGAAQSGAAAPSCQIAASPRSAPLADLGSRAAKFRSVAEHYEQIIAMASAGHAGKGPWGGDAPLLSFLCPVFNPPAEYLEQLWRSFGPQRQGAAELVLCDDGSSSAATVEWLEAHKDIPFLKILRRSANEGIAAATNAALSVAQGKWVALIDHDDALTPFAVDCIIDALEQEPDAEFLYTDEVVADAKLEPREYFLKPAFDPVLLSGVNYVNHLSIYRRDRLREIGGMRQGYEGSQDYNLLMRYLSGVAERRILHLPYPAYIWRRDGRSFSAKFMEKATQNARRAIAERYAVGGAPAIVDPALDANLHRIRFDRRERTWPRVSVIIPSRNAFPLISRLLDDLVKRTDYPDLEIIVVDNGTTDKKVLDLYETMRKTHADFRAEIKVEPFNFSRQINRGVRLAQGEYLLLLNNDIEVLDPSWLKEMVSCFDYPETGIVGARLLYPNGSLQHAGVIAGLGSVAGHWFCGMPSTFPGPMGRLTVRQSFAAVTAACMMLSRRCADTVGEFDEPTFAIAYNDIDFCLRAGRAGFRVVWTPFATLRHYESATRGSDETKENIERFNRDKDALRRKYSLAGYVDPAYNPLYGRDDSRPRYMAPSVLPGPRTFRV